MDMTLEELIQKARTTTMTPEEREAQRQSFAYGNTKLENDRITRDTIRRASDQIKLNNNASFATADNNVE